MFEMMFCNNYGYHHLRIILLIQHTIRRGAEKGMKQHSLMLQIKTNKYFSLFFFLITVASVPTKRSYHVLEPIKSAQLKL